MIEGIWDLRFLIYDLRLGCWVMCRVFWRRVNFRLKGVKGIYDF